MSYKSRRILQIFHSPEIYVSSVGKTNVQLKIKDTNWSVSGNIQYWGHPRLFTFVCPVKNKLIIQSVA